MTAIDLRAALRRRRRSVALIAVLLGLGTVVAAHHAEPMGMPGHGMAVMAGFCLAVIGTASVLRVVTGVVVLPRRATFRIDLPSRAPVALVAPMARAGPIFLTQQVFRT